MRRWGDLVRLIKRTIPARDTGSFAASQRELRVCGSAEVSRPERERAICKS